jgi:ketosteroid isomerase-like protein
MASEDAIQRAVDESAIRNVIARIAAATDQGDLNEYASLFSDDAVLQMRSPPDKPAVVPPTRGRAAILAGGQKRRAEGMAGPGSHVAHAIQSSAVTVSGNTAQARTYVVIYKNAHAAPEAMAIRMYLDDLVRTPEGWKVSSRLIDSV